ncbi:hypothetical protein IW140_002743 [Coemansia sp. RSA 1813]|nr:hypothetical protein EV178_003623 [Coemansia sp. RSA 1646]KAJ1769097.1 hypothetical protein LPJ74_004331 [Coemansia sp. RSA 1843]KAJ2088394.1 hypothetical protein IW138_004270 [Coemansia sp. RSA 986]KAJ2213832.1 hypothetical protein EV179_003531 [Coemansia sp. RSA 487]KAJ2569855.1 hypothetical protein IW140_002743 [Coemansia sp. RSA 1813]
MLYSYLFILLGAALLAQAATPDRMASFYSAYLYKDEDQTSCMAAVMDAGAAFVAASCFVLTSDNKIDSSVKYRIQYTPTDDKTGPILTLSPSQVIIHPKFNPTTLENNIAVIQFQDGATNSYVGDISTQDFAGNTEVFVRRDYDVYESYWDAPVVFNQDADDSDCAEGSLLYAANKDWMSCTRAVTDSFASEYCSIPYGVMYKQDTSNNIVMSSIYSHSVIYGNDMCGESSKILSYYTMLWPYLGFAVSSLGRGISVFNQTTSSVYTGTTMNVMTSPKSASIAGTTVENGDLYPKQWDIEAEITSSGATRTISANNGSNDSDNDSMSQLATDSASDESDDESMSANASADESNGSDSSQSEVLADDSLNGSSISSSGLSKGQKIGIGVGVPLGVILVVIGCIILFHIWKVNRQDKAWDPNAETMNLQDIAFEIVADDIYTVPPPYSQASDEAGFNTKLSEETTEIKKGLS